MNPCSMPPRPLRLGELIYVMFGVPFKFMPIVYDAPKPLT